MYFYSTGNYERGGDTAIWSRREKEATSVIFYNIIIPKLDNQPRFNADRPNTYFSKSSVLDSFTFILAQVNPSVLELRVLLTQVGE